MMSCISFGRLKSKLQKKEHTVEEDKYTEDFECSGYVVEVLLFVFPGVL